MLHKPTAQSCYNRFTNHSGESRPPGAISARWGQHLQRRNTAEENKHYTGPSFEICHAREPPAALVNKQSKGGGSRSANEINTRSTVKPLKTTPGHYRMQCQRDAVTSKNNAARILERTTVIKAIRENSWKLRGSVLLPFFNFVQSYINKQRRDKYHIMHTKVAVMRNIRIFPRYFQIYISAQVGSVTHQCRSEH